MNSAADVARTATRTGRDHRVVVIGAGIGGLVAALQLAQRNLQVTLVEAMDAPGGKMRQPVVDGAPIDSGPTVFTMRWIFEQIYESAGRKLDQELSLTPLPVLPDLLKPPASCSSADRRAMCMTRSRARSSGHNLRR